MAAQGERLDEIVVDRNGKLQRQHGDEMHRPDAAADDDRAFNNPQAPRDAPEL